MLFESKWKSFLLENKKIIFRQKDWGIISDEATSFLQQIDTNTLFWRGVSNEEFEFINKNGYILSNGSYCLRGEGTCFSEQPEDAESYINFGRTDPRKTNIPTFLVGVEIDSLRRDKDGYYKTNEKVGKEKIKYIIKFFPDKYGNLIGELENFSS